MPIGGLGDGEAIWHADMTYIERPPMAAILYAIEIPPAGGDTYWANMCARLRDAARRTEAAHRGPRGGARRDLQQRRHDAQRLPGRERSAHRARARAIRWCARIPKPAANACSSAAGATATWLVWSSTRAKRCSTSCGRTPRSRSSPSGSNGGSATCWCGTTAAPCTGATRSTRARGGSCTARRSGGDLISARSCSTRLRFAEIAPPEARGRAHLERFRRRRIRRRPRNPEAGCGTPRTGSLPRSDDGRARQRCHALRAATMLPRNSIGAM